MQPSWRPRSRSRLSGSEARKMAEKLEGVVGYGEAEDLEPASRAGSHI